MFKGQSVGSPEASDTPEDTLPSPWGPTYAADSQEAACNQEASAGSLGASAALHPDAGKERHRAEQEAAGWDQDS